MYAGRILESGPSGELIAAPRHPYTQLLVESVPRRGPSRPPAPAAARAGRGAARPGCTGCPFAARCPSRMPVCDTTMPGPEYLAQSRPLGPLPPLRARRPRRPAAAHRVRRAAGTAARSASSRDQRCPFSRRRVRQTDSGEKQHSEHIDHALRPRAWPGIFTRYTDQAPVGDVIPFFDEGAYHLFCLTPPGGRAVLP